MKYTWIIKPKANYTTAKKAIKIMPS